MRDFVVRLRRSWLAQLAARYFEPRSTYPSEAFRERAIRVVALVALVFFSLTLIFTIGVEPYPRDALIQTLGWYAYIFGLIGLILFVLRKGNVRLAGRLAVLAIPMIILDTSKAYWSPGTVIFSVLFTFLFEMVLYNWREITIAIGLNLLVYTWIALSAVGPSPLPADDYFSGPLSGLLTVYTSHLIIMGVAYYIRREQQARDRTELLVKQQQVDILRQSLYDDLEKGTLECVERTLIYLKKRNNPIHPLTQLTYEDLQRRKNIGTGSKNA